MRTCWRQSRSPGGIQYQFGSFGQNGVEVKGEEWEGYRMTSFGPFYVIMVLGKSLVHQRMRSCWRKRVVLRILEVAAVFVLFGTREAIASGFHPNSGPEGEKQS